eukprot:scaffold15381_cov36-Phaeocystis_antarctica.AAC.1
MAWPGRVAQAPRERVERALLGPAHHVGARHEMRRVGGPATAPVPSVFKFAYANLTTPRLPNEAAAFHPWRLCPRVSV